MINSNKPLSIIGMLGVSIETDPDPTKNSVHIHVGPGNHIEADWGDLPALLYLLDHYMAHMEGRQGRVMPPNSTQSLAGSGLAGLQYYGNEITRPRIVPTSTEEEITEEDIPF